LAAGMDAYVAKPIVARDLFEAMEQVLSAEAPGDGEPPTPAADGAGGGFDRAVAMERVGGDAQLLRELAGMFLVESPRWLADVRAAVAAGDLGKLKRAAHTLKGAVGTFGARAAFDAALELETRSRAGDLADAGRWW